MVSLLCKQTHGGEGDSWHFNVVVKAEMWGSPTLPGCTKLKFCSVSF